MASGRQLKVYLHPDDRPAVDDFVQQQLACVLLLERSRERDLLKSADSVEGAGRFICPGSRTQDLKPRFVESREEWVLDTQSGPLIEWWFSKLDNNLLFPGRFYYLSRWENDVDLDGSVDFRQVADQLFKWVRKYSVAVSTEWGPERLGPVAAMMVKTGKVSLRRNSPGSRI